MKATISMESLWQTVRSLSKNNKKWLAKKLLEDIREEETEGNSKDEEIELARRQYKAGNAVVCKTAEEAVKHLEAL